jgi:hypothetical protein
MNVCIETARVSLDCNLNVLMLVISSCMECLVVITVPNAKDFFIIQASKVCHLHSQLFGKHWNQT